MLSCHLPLILIHINPQNVHEKFIASSCSWDVFLFPYSVPRTNHKNTQFLCYVLQQVSFHPHDFMLLLVFDQQIKFPNEHDWREGRRECIEYHCDMCYYRLCCLLLMLFLPSEKIINIRCASRSLWSFCLMKFFSLHSLMDVDAIMHDWNRYSLSIPRFLMKFFLWRTFSSVIDFY